MGMRADYRVPKNVRKMIITELYQYWENKKQLEEMQSEILEASANPPDGQPRGTIPGNPTEQKAIKLRTTRSILVMERKLGYIENAIKRLNKEEKEIFEIIFKERHNQKMAETYKHIQKDPYYNVYNKIIYLTALEFGEIY